MLVALHFLALGAGAGAGAVAVGESPEDSSDTGSGISVLLVVERQRMEENWTLKSPTYFLSPFHISVYSKSSFHLLK